ncbi:lytic transglycosylase domain-containing protein [Glycomyces paridis]|uniref:Lytic transglycosylase domain-containing protein n=1 Tax=Glycomyces paridis TaxID=2126555 RepID=A0A4S8PLY7_9ACTN|nr:lytic transglycosylase domain-containing protein [Glycomyces paridis]THV31903.1 lytic transglycosylase domain-containing protein [Glycomyces paridis]
MKPQSPPPWPPVTAQATPEPVATGPAPARARLPRLLLRAARWTAVLPWRALKALGRGVRACARALNAPTGRLGVQVALTVLALAGTLAAGWLLVPGAGPAWSFGTEPSAQTEEAPLVLAPEDAPVPGLPAETDPVDGATTASPTDAATSSAAADLDAWARSLTHLGISERALLSYGRAELLSDFQNPGCNLSWTTLAGIGAVETNHGTTGGNRLQADGTTLTPIIGADYQEKGPMQFLDSTWETWKADGNGDGEYDPHNIDDATTAAANYLCHDGHDMTDPADWYEAVYSYNHLDSYVRQVFDRADDYGRKSTA